MIGIECTNISEYESVQNSIHSELSTFSGYTSNRYCGRVKDGVVVPDIKSQNGFIIPKPKDEDWANHLESTLNITWTSVEPLIEQE